MSTAYIIATVPVEGGGRIGVSPLPGRVGDLLADVAAIARWNPEIVVSMTEEEEMERCGAGDLGSVLADASIDWFHLPISDYGGPAGAAEEAWPALSARLHGVLDEGGGVLLHCHGGRGRSGMIALRLLVERGEPMEEALARLRAARPGAVEAPAQFAWAARGAIEG
ncbi:dual specificity protein phosphatase family protein [Chelativorans xinjiangense]|uniref:phosphatase domain-containing putative toxin n=1 Tax=Chelativorans xinjiangense TaxID=2681485 RepID=UPI00135C5124|nr:dual specificity protein phosphatase family protein [Chelativorans xinjiangense]